MKKRPLCFTCLALILIQALVFILTSGNGYFEIPASSVFGEQAEQTVWVKGQVYKKADTSNSQVLYLKNNSIIYQDKSFEDSRIMIYGNNFTDIPIGANVHIKGKTGFFEVARNPGNFNQALYYARQRIYGYLRCEEILEVSSEKEWIKDSLYELKCILREKIVHALGEKDGAILSAMLLGEKSEMDEEIRELYQKNGIAHILAISGLHISFIGLGLYKILRKTGVGYGCSGLLAVLVLSLYVLMIGFSVSVVRAYVMLLLRIGADMTGRVYDMITALLLAAWLTILYQPLYFTDGGFYLSYGAILGICMILPAMKHSFRCKSKVLDGMMASVAINVMLFPVLLFFYYEFPIYSVLLNMFVVPIMSVVMSAGMVGSLFLFIVPIIGEYCLKLCGLIFSFFEWLSEKVSLLPSSRLVLGQPRMWEVVLYYMLLVIILSVVHLQKDSRRRWIRKWSWICLGIAITCIVHKPTTNLSITMLDVGQGDGLVIRGPNGNTYMIDGGSSDVGQLGKYRIEPYLKSQGIGTLDYVFLTHGDSDHSNGVLELLKRQHFGVRIETLVLPINFRQDESLRDIAELALEKEVQVVMMQAGENLTEGEMKIHCLQPSADEKILTGNAGSLVLEVVYGEFVMLCTGDVELEGERMLISKVKGKEYDVLKVAHHGSKNSTTEQFLQEIRPKMALISVGEDNSYGHPHAETIERLKKVRCRVYQTKENGAIMLLTDGNSLTISSLPYRL